jgi:16S rRNA (cytosine967-C5)-methyltransferase
MQLSSLLGHTQEILGLILNSPRPADGLIDQFFRGRKYLGSHDRRFIAESTYGTLRHLRRCEWAFQRIHPSLQSDLFPEDRLLMLIVTHHVLEQRQPALTVEAILPRVKSSRIQEALPEILARLDQLASSPEQRDCSLGIRYSFPDWMIDRFIKEYGEETTASICESLNHPAPLTLRANTLRTTREQCQSTLREQGVETTPTTLSPVGLHVAKRIGIFAPHSATVCSRFRMKEVNFSRCLSIPSRPPKCSMSAPERAARRWNSRRS